MNLLKYIVVILAWAIFYLVVAFAIAIGFRFGWHLMDNWLGTTSQKKGLNPTSRRNELTNSVGIVKTDQKSAYRIV